MCSGVLTGTLCARHAHRGVLEHADQALEGVGAGQRVPTLDGADVLSSMLEEQVDG